MVGHGPVKSRIVRWTSCGNRTSPSLEPVYLVVRFVKREYARGIGTGQINDVHAASWGLRVGSQPAWDHAR